MSKHTKKKSHLIPAFAAALMLPMFTLTACDPDEGLDDVNDHIEDVGDEIEDAGEEIIDEVEDIGND